MKGVICIDSYFYEIEFEEIPCSNCSYRQTGIFDQNGIIIPGSKNFISIDWGDFIFTTKEKIKETLRVKPFILFCEDGNSLSDESAFFKEFSGEINEKEELEYKYTIGIRSPKMCFDKKKIREIMGAKVLNLYKVYLVKKRLEQNKNVDIYNKK